MKMQIMFNDQKIQRPLVQKCNFNLILMMNKKLCESVNRQQMALAIIDTKKRFCVSL